MKTKLLTTFAVLTLASSSYAGAYLPTCNPDNVAVPCDVQSWELGVDALYLYPGTGHFLSDYRWGFRIDAAYHYGKGKAVAIDWMHYRAIPDSSRRVTHIAHGLGAGTAYRKFQADLDLVNATVAQQMVFSSDMDASLYGGLQYARMPGNRDEATTSDQRTGDLPTFHEVYREKKLTSGIGPLIGININYHLIRSFNIFVDGWISYLSTWESQSDYGLQTNLNLPPEQQNLTWGAPKLKTHNVTMGFGGKAGASYTYGMKDGKLMVRAGWQATEFLCKWGGLFLGGTWSGNL